MDTKENCVLKIVEAAGGAINERQAAELLRQSVRDVRDMPAISRLMTADAVMAEAIEKRLGANRLHDIYSEMAEIKKEIFVANESVKILQESNAPVGQYGLDISREDRLKWENTGEVPSWAKKKGIAGAIKDRMLALQDTVLAAENQMVAPLYAMPKEYEHLLGDSAAIREALAVAFDGGSTENLGVKRIADTYKKIGDTLRVNLARAGAPIAPDVNPLFTSRITDPNKLMALGKEGFADLVEGLNIRKEYLPDKHRDNIRAYADDMYDSLTKISRSNSFDYNHLSYLLDSNKAANLAERFGVSSNIPFADSASFLRYAEAVSDKPLGELMFSRVRQAGKAVGLMNHLGPTPGKTMVALLDELAPNMNQAEKQFFLGQGANEPPLHTASIDGTWKNLPAIDKEGRTVPYKQAVADLALSPEAWADKYGKQKVVDFESETLARQAVAKEKQNMLKGIKDLSEQLSFGMPKPSTLIAQLLGDLNAPENVKMSTFTSMINNLTSASLLGNGIIAQIPDAAFQAAYLTPRTGKSGFDIFARNVLNLFPDKTTKEVMERLGQTAEAALENLMDINGTTSHMPSQVNLATSLAYKLNGMRIWDTAIRRTSHELYMDEVVRAVRSGDIRPAMRDELRAAGFNIETLDPEISDIAKLVAEAAIQNDRGVWLIDPALISDADAAFKFFVAAQQAATGGTASPTSFDRAILSLGTKAGTMEGSLVRLLGSFKSFPVLMATRILPRVGYDQGTAGKMATLVSAAVMWYIADSAKQMANGRDPRDLRNPNTLFKMAAMTGGFGYSELLIDPTASSTDQAVARLAGPSISALVKASRGGIGLGKAAFGLFTDNDDETEKGMRDFWKGVGAFTPSLGPIANTRMYGGQTALEFFYENATLGVAEALMLIDPSEDERRRREADTRYEKDFGAP